MNIKLTNTDYFFIFSVLLLYIYIEISKLQEPLFQKSKKDKKKEKKKKLKKKEKKGNLSFEQKIKLQRERSKKDFCAAQKIRDRIAEEDAVNKIRLDNEMRKYQKQHDQRDRIRRYDYMPKLNPHTVLSLNVDTPKFQPGYNCANIMEEEEERAKRRNPHPPGRGMNQREIKAQENLTKDKFLTRWRFSCGDEGAFPNNEYPSGDFLSKGWTGSRQKWICNKEKNTICKPTTQWHELWKYNEQKENERRERKLPFDHSSDWNYSPVENTQRQIAWYPYAGKNDGPITVNGRQDNTYNDRLRNSNDAEMEDVVVKKWLANRDLAKPIWSDVVDLFPMDLRNWEREEPGPFDPTLYMSKKERKQQKKQEKKAKKQQKKEEKRRRKSGKGKKEEEEPSQTNNWLTADYWRNLLNIK